MNTWISCAAIFVGATAIAYNDNELQNIALENAYFHVVNDPDTDFLNAIYEIMQRNPSAAIHSLNLAEIRSNSDESSLLFIYFCRVIAYDQLGERNQAYAVLEKLCSNYVPVDEPYVDPCELNDLTAFLKFLTSFAPSPDIQNHLFQNIEESALISMEECHCCQGAIGENLNSERSHEYSKFLKRWLHILKRVGEILEIIRAIQHIINDSKELIE
jgi:hypothetical protein